MTCERCGAEVLYILTIKKVEEPNVPVAVIAVCYRCLPEVVRTEIRGFQLGIKKTGGPNHQGRRGIRRPPC